MNGDKGFKCRISLEGEGMVGEGLGSGGVQKCKSAIIKIIYTTYRFYYNLHFQAKGSLVNFEKESKSKGVGDGWVRDAVQLWTFR